MKFIFISFLLSCLSLHIYAQKDDFLKEKRQEFAIFGGTNTDIDWGYLDVYRGVAQSNSNLPYYSVYSKDKVTTGIWGVSYFYRLPYVGDRITVGSSLSYLNHHLNYHDRLSDAKMGKVSNTHYSISPSIRFAWVKRQWWQLYSAVGLTLDIEKSENEVTRANDFVSTFKDSDTSFSGKFNCTFVGASVGKRYFGFAEVNGGGPDDNIYFVFGAGYRF